jgi:hypothetical protein
MALSQPTERDPAWEPAPHGPVAPEHDLDDKVCTCAPEPYWVEWLEQQEQAERDRIEQQRREEEQAADNTDPRGCA